MYVNYKCIPHKNVISPDVIGEWGPLIFTVADAILPRRGGTR